MLAGVCVTGSIFFGLIIIFAEYQPRMAWAVKWNKKMEKGKNRFIPIGLDKLKEIGLNRLKEIRVGQGLTITALSKYANVSTKVISQTERMLIDPTLVTKNKIVKGLNAVRSTREKLLDYKDVFPDF